MPDNLIAELAKEFISGNTEEVVDVITFVEASWGLNIKLLPVQRFILKCLYGMELNTFDKNINVPDVTNEHILYTFSEVEFLKWLYEEGRCNVDETEGKIFQELVLAIGRRGTKSTLSSCISNYELYKLVKRGDPSKFYNFPPNTQISILNVAPTDDQSGIVFDMTKAMAMRCPYMRDRSLHDTMTYFDLQTDADIKMHGRPKASLVSIAGGCSSNALRGRNAIIVVMDEMAHFIDNNGRFSGSEVYKALTPSISSFGRDGKIISISSPYAKFGSFYDRFVQSFDEPEITLMFKMYSSMVNPTIPTEILKAARRRDRVGFGCEYGGEFSDSVVAWIDDEDEFKRCVIRDKPNGRGVRDINYFMGIDIGFKNDGNAISIVHKEKNTGKIILDYADCWFSESSDVWEYEDGIYKDCDKYAGNELLKMGDLVKDVQELLRWFPIKAGVFDQSNGYALAELLRNKNIKPIVMEHFTDKRNSEIYQLAKRLYAEGLLELHDHPVLVPEMLSLEAEKKPGKKILVRAPNRRGAHDDISDAFVRAIWMCYSGYKDRTLNLSVGAGGNMGPTGSINVKGIPGAPKQETPQSYHLKKIKMHGDHPRGAYKGLRSRTK